MPIRLKNSYASGYPREVDDRNEKVGYKIREAQLQKVPYMLIVGEKEAESAAVSVRDRAEGDLGAMATEAFAAKVLEEIKNKHKKVIDTDCQYVIYVGR